MRQTAAGLLRQGKTRQRLREKARPRLQQKARQRLRCPNGRDELGRSGDESLLLEPLPLLLGREGLSHW